MKLLKITTIDFTNSTPNDEVFVLNGVEMTREDLVSLKLDIERALCSTDGYPIVSEPTPTWDLVGPEKE